jgi:catechol 2,3-dioxygenase-like lactoylglutathione lyase family enzyme
VIRAALLLAALAGSPPGTVRVEAVGPIGITVSDADRAVAFYRDVLDFRVVSDVEVAGEPYERLTGVFPVRKRVVRMALGEEEIELTDYLAPASRPIPPGLRSNDLSFQHVAVVVSDMEAAYATLRRHGVEHVSSGPQRLPDWNPSAGGIEAFYFRDPDGHVLEVIRFPEGKGDPRWRRAGGRLFLGIDHTAIVVDRTDGALAFYRDALGLEVAGESHNWGPEQERLNAVFGARLHITALRAPRGPGIEFLDYVVPADGRPRPDGVLPSDLLHWQTRLVVDDPAAAAAALARRGHAWISPGAVELPEPRLGVRRAALVRDPDGHVLELAETPGQEENP